MRIKCPYGEGKGYCSAIESNAYYVCENGVNERVQCNPGLVCSKGQCFPYCLENTCSQLGKECGTWYNGCSGSLQCGTCPTGKSCNNIGRCEDSTPKTCAQLGKSCGYWSDNFGNSIFCGECQTGLVCDDIGNCSPPCVRKTCQELGKQCGNVNDGCHGLLQCGQCQGENEECFGNKCVLKEDFCKDCDSFVLNQLIGSVWEDKKCKQVGILDAVLNIRTPQSNTICFLSWIKYALIIIALILGTLFSSDFLTRFKSIRRKPLIIWILSLIIASILAYLIYVMFWIGVISLIVYMLISIGFRSIPIVGSLKIWKNKIKNI